MQDTGVKMNSKKRNVRSLTGKILFILGLVLLFGSGIAVSQSSKVQKLKIIEPTNKDFVYEGRVDFSNPKAPDFYWSGNSATIGFTGNKLSVILDDKQGNNYFDIIIDGDGADRYVIACQKGKHIYPVPVSLTDTRHTVQIFKRTDPTWPGTKFEGIEIDEKGKVFNPEVHHNLKIAYYGDSITSGYGVLSITRKGEGNPSEMDNYVAYDAITARHFNADYHNISRSGIGILKSWYPLVMPQMFNRLNPGDPQSHWDFAKWVPDIIVINLFQNDSWLLPREKKPPSKEQIIQAYIDFVHSLYIHYPKATYICMLGNMDITRKGSPWPGYVRKAVAKMQKIGEINVYDLTVPYKKTPGHPNIKEQRILAHYLIREIDKVYYHK